MHIFVDTLDPALVAPIAAAVRAERPVALTINVDGASIGEKHLVYGDSGENGEVGEKARGAARARARPGSSRWARRRCSSRRSRRGPNMYVFGAIDFASTLASIGRFLGYHVTVCDARAKFVTPERFPDVDELVVDWPDRFLASAPVDERTAICVLTHDDEVRRADPEAGAVDERRLHRRHGLAAHHRAPLRAAARGRRDGRGARARARADRPPDRLAHARRRSRSRSRPRSSRSSTRRRRASRRSAGSGSAA